MTFSFVIRTIRRLGGLADFIGVLSVDGFAVEMISKQRLLKIVANAARKLQRTKKTG